MRMPNGRTSARMARHAKLAIIGCAMLCSITNLLIAVDAHAKDCQLAREASIDFTIAHGVLLEPVMINDHPAQIVVEPANIFSVMRRDHAEQFGLVVDNLPGSAQVNFAGARLTQISRVASFKAGTTLFGKVEFLLSPAENFTPATTDPPIVGLLGLDAFANHDFEFDFANKKFNLYAQDHCPGSVVYWTNEYAKTPITRGPLGNYYFPMELDGKKVEATISTTFAGNTLTTDVTRSLYGFDEKSTDIETDRNGRPRSYYRAMTLTGNGIKIVNARIQLRTSKQSSCSLTYGPEHSAVYTGCMGGEAPLKLGLDVAQHLHLYFATKEKMLYLSDVAASK